MGPTYGLPRNLETRDKTQKSLQHEQGQSLSLIERQTERMASRNNFVFENEGRKHAHPATNFTTPLRMVGLQLRFPLPD